jgi:hypothetical protein
MASTSLWRSSAVPRALKEDPVQDLRNAVDEFKAGLTDEERSELARQAEGAGNTHERNDANAVMAFTAALDDRIAEKRKGSKGDRLACRLQTMLESVRDISAVIDMLVSAHPEIAGLVWGCVKFAFIVSLAS